MTDPGSAALHQRAPLFRVRWKIYLFMFGLSLLAYVAAAFVVHHPWWPTVAVSAIIPHVEWSGAYVLNIVALLGTTITPYCFFWQADQLSGWDSPTSCSSSSS